MLLNKFTAESVLSLKMYEHCSYLEDSSLAARCLRLNSFLIDRIHMTKIKRRHVVDHDEMKEGMASALLKMHLKHLGKKIIFLEFH